jgi:hypothetical protein
MLHLFLLILPAFVLSVTGCGRPTPDPAASLKPGISWASLLCEASDLRTLARPVEPNAVSRMCSSSKDTNKVMLASLAPHITGDMDWTTSILWYGTATESNRGVAAGADEVWSQFLALRSRTLQEAAQTNQLTIPAEYAAVLNALKAGDPGRASNTFYQVLSSITQFAEPKPNPRLDNLLWPHLQDLY